MSIFSKLACQNYFVYKNNVLNFFRALHFWWQLNSSNIEHVRIVIDQNYESVQSSNRTSFLIVNFFVKENFPKESNFKYSFQRKVIGIRPQETVRDLIKKCIEAFHLQVC